MDMSIKERELLLKSQVPPQRRLEVCSELPQQWMAHYARTADEANRQQEAERQRMAACDKSSK